MNGEKLHVAEFTIEDLPGQAESMELDKTFITRVITSFYNLKAWVANNI